MLSDASSAPDPADVGVKAAALKRGARIEVYWEEELEYYVGTMTATRLVGTRKIRQHHVKNDVTTGRRAAGAPVARSFKNRVASC